MKCISGVKEAEGPLKIFCLLVPLVVIPLSLLQIYADFGTVLFPRDSNETLSPPVQTPADRQIVFDDKPYKLLAKQEISVTGRVLSKSHYYFDRVSDIAPFDFAMGWGVMAKKDIPHVVDIWQGGRWYYWQKLDVPAAGNIVIDDIIKHSSNFHLIPKSREIKIRMMFTKKYDIVRMKGYLVNVVTSGGMVWKSSISREDTGAGACEIMFVEEYEVLDQ